VERPTIEKLAEFLRSKSPGIPARRAVLLQDGPLAAPLFCVPGAGSDVFALAQLARWFASDRPFYALQYPGLDGDPQRLRTVEEISGLLLSDLRAIQPDGPILLAGSSFGGLVAVELARHLVAEGRAVAFVGLLDSFGFDYPRLRRHLPLRHHALDLLRRVFPLGRKDELSWSNLRAGFREHLVRIHARRAMRRPGGVVPGAEEKFIYLQEMCFCARDRYAFPPSHIRLHLFRAETGVPDFLYAPDPAMGWSGVAAGGLSIVPVPGSHGFHILDPNAEILAQSMCVAIREALERSPGDAVPVAATRAAWDALAGWWDQQVGDDGNPHTSERLAPVTERLLALRAGERVIDAGCGNGWFSRRLARQGARVLAFDFSEEFIRRARVRNEGAGNPEYLVLDATSEDELRALAPDSFDSAVSTMALHDMATIDPLMAALARAVRPGGRFVFSVPHGPVGASGAGEPTLALAGQPHPHYSFHRPLEDILALGTKRGWRCDGNETVMLGEGEAAVWIVRLTRT
jgi:thioesterase domain-containing protein/SAM-dependent methyltransferase